MTNENPEAPKRQGAAAVACTDLLAAPTFTPKQLADWRAYERVRQGGRYNMFDPRARRLTKLSEERYNFTLCNYSALKAANTELRRGAKE